MRVAVAVVASWALLACEGPPGPPGPPGSPGEMGEMGTMGERGQQGMPGAMGDRGLQGPAGQAGPAGAQGPMGLTGAMGPRGDTGASAVQVAQDIVNRVLPYRKAIVRIVCPEGKGTGIKLRDGSVLTAYHVIEPCTAVGFLAEGAALGGGGRKLQPIVGRDVGLLDMITWTAAGASVEGVDVVENYKPKIGDLTLLASYPANVDLDAQFTFGFVADDDAQATLLAAGATDWTGAFTTDSVAARGSSGGPVFNQRGDLVAIHVGHFLADPTRALDLSVMLPIRLK